MRALVAVIAVLAVWAFASVAVAYPNETAVVVISGALWLLIFFAPKMINYKD